MAPSHCWDHKVSKKGLYSSKSIKERRRSQLEMFGRETFSPFSGPSVPTKEFSVPLEKCVNVSHALPWTMSKRWTRRQLREIAGLFPPWTFQWMLSRLRNICTQWRREQSNPHVTDTALASDRHMNTLTFLLPEKSTRPVCDYLEKLQRKSSMSRAHFFWQNRSFCPTFFFQLLKLYCTALVCN